MRLVLFTSLATLLAVAPVAQPDQVLALDNSNLTVELPDGYVLQTSCEIPADFVALEGESIGCDEFPRGTSSELQTATYIFVDLPRYRHLSVSVHNYFTEDGRIEWVDGARALAGLRGTFTPAEQAEWTNGDAVAAHWSDGLGAGVVLYGCEGFRCFRVFASGPATDLQSDPDHFRTVLEGVAVHRLAAPVAIQRRTADK